MECSAQSESLSTSPPILDDTYHFIEATRSLLDEGDVTALDTLASRLSPFRIQYRSVVAGDIISVKPVLVLEHEQSPIKDLWKSTEIPCFNVGATQKDGSAPITSFATLNNGTTNTDLYKQGLTTPALTNTVPASYEGESHESSIVYAHAPRCGNELGVGTQNSLATTNKVDLSQAHNAGLGLENTGHAVHGKTDYSGEGLFGDSTLPLPDLDLVDFDGCVYLTGGYNQPTDTTHMIQNTRSLSSADPTGDSIYLEFDSALQVAGNVGKGEPRAPPSEIISTPGNTPISDFGSPEGCLVSSNTLHDAVKGSASASDAALLKVNYALRICIRTDYIEFLETNLPRWVKHGIWRTVWPPNEAKGAHGYESLQKAYWNVCRLDRQMEDDAIRSRMAMVMLHLEYEKARCTWKSRTSTSDKLITAVGRGGITCLIDDIISNTYPEWASANSQRKSEMRAKFHDRKRYGKRWWMLVEPLGPSIIILCSSKFAGLMKNTAVTAKMIKDIERAVKNSRTGLLDILNRVNPIAQSLFLNDGYEGHPCRIKLPVLIEQPDST